MKIPIFITARLSSSRLPRKHLLDLGGRTVIEHVVLRCEHFGLEPFVCIPYEEKWPVLPHIKLYGGNPDDAEARVIEIAKSKSIKIFHHLDGDDPFFDDQEIKLSFNHISKFRKSLPSSLSMAGCASVGTTHNLKGRGEIQAWNSNYHSWPQRLTLDYPEDYHLLLAVNRMVGGYMAPRSVVDDLFIRNPDLHKINWFRNEEWKARQINEKHSHSI